MWPFGSPSIIAAQVEALRTANRRLLDLAKTRFFVTTTANPSSVKPTCSQRGQQAVQLLPSYLADARSVQKYSPETPQGALQLGVAESQLCEDWLVPALNESNRQLDAACIYYQPTHGQPGVRQAMAAYTEQLMGLKQGRLDPEGFVLGAGCNAVLENLCLCLAEPNQAVLIPKPYYAAFEFDLVARAGLFVQPVSIQQFHPSSRSTDNSQMYYPTAASLDAAFQQASEHGHEPKILLLSHPHNPLGICYPEETIVECLEWCRSRHIHLVSDEIYAGSIYRPNQAGFKSILNVAGDNLGPYVHWVYALSKDFALSGLRVGASYSENMDIRLPMQKLNDLCQISSQTQVWTENMLTKVMDDGRTWTSVFRQENHRRLEERCQALTACLDECGIAYLPPTAGLFCWIDMSPYLTTDPNMSDSERERELYLRLVNDFGLLLTPGDSMRNERPGFFRIVFTAASEEEFQLGLERFRKFAETFSKA